MKLIDSYFEIIDQGSGIDNLKKHIEKVARVSYKSEDKITNNSAEKMLKLLSDKKHFSPFEHGTVYLCYKYDFDGDPEIGLDIYKKNPYSRVKYVSNNDGTVNIFITTNYRVIVENKLEDDLEYLCDPTPHHEKRITVKFICSAGIGRELTRHRAFSFMQESTRFCNYSKNKFDNQLTFIIPQWIYDCRDEWAPCTRWPDEKMDYLYDYSGEQLVHHLTAIDRTVAAYYDILKDIEREYLFDVTEPDGYKLKPEEARGMLPLDIKSELVMTGFADDWIGFFKQRSSIASTGKPHPDMIKLIDPLMKTFISLKLIDYEQDKE